jgi:EpsI family protein
MTVLAAVLLVAGILMAHVEAIRGMVHLWDNSPMYSYGYLVPAISLYLLWSRRSALSALTTRPSFLVGGLVLALWAVMLIVGQLAGVQLLQQLALIVALVGVVLLVFGRRCLAAVWAPIAYLLLMVPLWDGFTEPLHEPFQRFSASIGVWILRIIGVPVHQEGNLLTLPTLTIEVARACSGVNYLIAVVALGLPLSYLLLRGVWRRVVLVGSAVGIAALSNGLRVALIGGLAHWEIGSPLHGPFHTLHGLFVSAVGFIVIFVGLWLLTPARGSSEFVTTVEREVPVAAGLRRPGLIACAAAWIWLVAVFAAAYEPRPVSLVASLDRMPDRLGAWTADSLALPPTITAWPSADKRWLRRYRNPEGHRADVFVAYFEAQHQRKEVVDYRAGALHRSASALPLPVRGQETPLVVNSISAQTTPGAVFWYEMDGATESGATAAKLRTLWHALTRARTNGAVVVLSAPREVSVSSRVTAGELSELAVDVHLALACCLPGRHDSAERTIARHDVPRRLP